MAVWNKINRFFNLNSSERQVFLIALGMVPVISLRLKLHGIKVTLARLDHTMGHKPGNNIKNEITLELALRTVNLVQKAIFYSPIKGTCLSQSIVLWYLLRRQGIEGEICIGVQKKEKKTTFTSFNLNAHAWVEYLGVVLNDLPDVRQRFNAFNYILGSSEK